MREPINLDHLASGQPIRVHTVYGESIDARFVALIEMTFGVAYRFENAKNSKRFVRYPHEIVSVDLTEEGTADVRTGR